MDWPGQTDTRTKKDMQKTSPMLQKTQYQIISNSQSKATCRNQCANIHLMEFEWE